MDLKELGAKAKALLQFSPFERRVPGWVGVDLSEGCAVAAVAPAAAGAKPRLLQFAEGENAGEALSRITNTDFGLVAVVPPSDYSLLLLERPAVKDEEMAQSLRWMLDARLDYPAAEANLAWLDVPAHEAQGNRPRQLYAVAAQKSVMDERTRLVEETGRLLSTIDVRETARRNLAALVEERSGSGVMLLVAEANGLQITVTFKGELYLERFIPEKVLEERSVGDTEARERQAERLALEIQRTLDFLRRNFPQVTLGEILVGPLPPEIGLASGLASRLSEPVRSLDLCEYFDWPTDSDFGKLEVQARYLTAIGAALRYRDARPA